ncbi:alpha-2-macroglobulin family protein [Staphylococcus aureus]
MFPINLYDLKHFCKFLNQHDTTRMFFVTVEAPTVIRRGEQVGLRLDIYNYWDRSLRILGVVYELFVYNKNEI